MQMICPPSEQLNASGIKLQAVLQPFQSSHAYHGNMKREEKQTERKSMAYLAQGNYRMPDPVPTCQGTGVSGMCVLPSGGRRDASHVLPLPAVGINSTLPA